MTVIALTVLPALVVAVAVAALPGPIEMPLRLIVCCPAPTATAEGFGMKLSVGGWLTGVTVTAKVSVVVFWPPLAMPPLSCTTTVIVAVPLALAAGVKTSVPVVAGLE